MSKKSAKKSLIAIEENPDFINVGEFPAVRVKLMYASTDNLLKENVYEDYNKAFLHKIAAEKFLRACQFLHKEYPGWSFVVFDALRPQSAQLRFWDLVKNTPQEIYFANPARGSLHSFGFAVDLSLLNEAGEELDMGTPFDDLTDLAQPRHEEKFLASKQLKNNQVQNRKFLRSIMERSGFDQLPHEWWHYDALPGSVVREKYKIVE